MMTRHTWRIVVLAAAAAAAAVEFVCRASTKFAPFAKDSPIRRRPDLVVVGSTRFALVAPV